LNTFPTRLQGNKPSESQSHTGHGATNIITDKVISKLSASGRLYSKLFLFQGDNWLLRSLATKQFAADMSNDSFAALPPLQQKTCTRK
jgi:hypothetical protein